MKSISDFLIENEDKGRAHQEALSKGLKYKGFGYWANPETGKTEYRTDKEQDKLVPIGQEEESGDLPKPGEDPSGKRGNQQQPPVIGTGQNVGTNPNPGEEKRPEDEEDQSWDPGPDGDHCVGDEEPPKENPADMFVNGSNDPEWTAGPDGSNYKKMSFDKIMKEALLVERSKSENILDQSTKENNKSESNSSSSNPMDEYKRREQVQADKDKKKVGEMNKKIQGMITNPNFDIENINDYPEIGRGVFGTVYDAGDHVIKEGNIGENELEALSRLKDNPAFPTLVNARYEKPFAHQSSTENNPLAQSFMKAKHSGGKYWDPDEKDSFGEFEERHPGAWGRYAMTKAEGVPLSDYMDWDYDRLSEKEQENLKSQFWKIRAQMHMAGLSHNDMHGGNIVVDPETKQISVIDLGLSNTNPVTALMEAMGGTSENEGDWKGDWQLSRSMKYTNLPKKMQKTIDNNRKKVLGLMEDVGLDEEMIETIMEGEIRMKRNKIEQIEDTLNTYGLDVQDLIQAVYTGMVDLDNDGEPETPINKVTAAFKNSPERAKDQIQRMAAAADEREKEIDLLSIANKIRARRGASEIKAPRVVPKRNWSREPEEEFTETYTQFIQKQVLSK